MNFGGVLLGNGAILNSLSQLADTVWNIFPSFLYVIWKLLAWLADAIENVFRALAGLTSKNNPNQTDLALEVLKSPAVVRIFKNLMGIAAILLVFFTIVKIIQQQYKEKEGGNPYQIVFRMFKGMLMLFFVTGAVYVGLLVSGVVFKALDAATRDNASSISGQIFKAMAGPANRLRVGEPNPHTAVTRAQYLHYNRLVEQAREVDGSGDDLSKWDKNTNKKYTIAYMDDGAGTGSVSQARIQELLAAREETNWGILEDDGVTVTPLLQYIDATDKNWTTGTAYEKDFWDNWSADSIEKKVEFGGAGSFDVGGRAEYQNELLSVFAVNFTPRISLNWSPIDIFEHKWMLNLKTRIPGDELVMKVLITKGSLIFDYDEPKDSGVLQPISEDNFFTIGLNAGVTLADGRIGATFNLTQYVAQAPVTQIITYILANYAFYSLVTEVFGSIKNLKLVYDVKGWPIDLRVLARVFVPPVINAVSDGFLSNLIDAMAGNYDEGDDEGTNSYARESFKPFLKMNSDTDITSILTEYRFADKSNFERLAQQFNANIEEIKRSLANAADLDRARSFEAKTAADNAKLKAEKMQNWINYATMINEYNQKVAVKLEELCDLALQEKNSTDDTEKANLRSRMKQLLYEDKEDSIYALQQTLNEQSRQYHTARPTSVDALPSLNESGKTRIYKPILTTTMSESDFANIFSDSSTQSVYDLLTGKISGKNFKINLASGKYTSYAGAYPIVDWDAYYHNGNGSANPNFYYSRETGKIADVFESQVAFNQGIQLFGVNVDKVRTILNNAVSNSFPYKDWSIENEAFMQPMDDPDSSEYEFPSSLVDTNAKLHAKEPKKATKESGVQGVLDDINEQSGDTTGASGTAISALSGKVHPSGVSQFSFFDDLKNAASALDDANTSTQTTTNELDSSLLHFVRIMPNGEAANDGEAGSTTNLVVAQSDWVTLSESVLFTKNPTEITPIYAMEDGAKEIDDCMVGKKAGHQYLLIADKSKGDLTKPASQLTRVGLMTYKDMDVVNSLYKYWNMNFLIGFVGIIVATSTYLNFMFGLIQRVVNMAVLYIMSPVTIAFYPFDDGQRFSSSFVMPFYKQTISAYAIVLSLNLYFVLFGTVQKAVTKVTNDFIGIFAMIAFISMLPKIRETITGLLGADSISEKGIKDVFKDAGSALNQYGALTFAANTAKNTKDKWDKNKGKRQDRRKAFFDKTIGQTEWMKNHRAKKKADQDAVDEAMKKGGTDDEKKQGLTKKQQALYDRQKKAADKLAKKKVENMTAEQKKAAGLMTVEELEDQAKNGTKEERDAANKKLKALRARQARAAKDGKNLSLQELLDRKENKGKIQELQEKEQQQMAQMRDQTNRNWFMRGVKGAVSIKNSAKGKLKSAKQGVQEFFKYTLIGDLAEAMFHPITGAIANTTLGKAVKWNQWSEQNKRWKQMEDAEAEWRAAKLDAEGVRHKQMTGAADAIMKAENDKDGTIKKLAAAKQVQYETENSVEYKAAKAAVAEITAGGKDGKMTEKFRALVAQEALKEGFTEKEANEYAQTTWNEQTVEQRTAHFTKQITEMEKKFAKRQNDLATGADGAKIDQTYMDAAREEWDTMSKQDRATLEASRKEVSATTKGNVSSIMERFQTAMKLEGEDRISQEAYTEIAQAVHNGESVDRITERLATKIKGGAEKQAEIKQALSSVGLDMEISRVRMQEGTDNMVLNSVLSYQKSYDKARDWAYEDLGVSIDSVEFKHYLDTYRAAYDRNVAGGLLQQEEILRAKYHGNIDNAEYQKEWNALRKKFMDQMDEAISSVGRLKTIRERDYGVRQREREQAEYVNVMGKEYRNRIDYHLNVMMSDNAKRVMNTDTLIREDRARGDNVGAAMRMSRAIEYAKQQRFDELKGLVDQQTAEQFRQWASSGEGGLKELNSIQEYFDITRKFMGNAQGESGGHHLDAVRNQMAAMFQVIENKEITEFYDRQIKMLGDAEGALRRQLAVYTKTMQNTFAADAEVWKEAAKRLHLDPVATQAIQEKGFGGYMSDVLTRLATGELLETDPEYVELSKQIGKLSADWMSDKKLNSLMAGNRASAVLDGLLDKFSAGIQAMDNSRETDLLQGYKGDLLKSNYLTYNKIYKQGNK